MRRSRAATLLVAAALLLAACSPTGTDDTTPDEDPTDEPPVDDPEAQPPETPEFSIEDGVFRGIGLVVPIAEGWELDETMLAQGLVAMGPLEEEGQEALVAAAGIEENPLLGFEGLDYDGTLDVVRQLDPESEPEVDEAVEIEGAEQAQLIVFRDVAAMEQELPDTDTFVLVAEGAGGQLAMFNYSAEAGAYDNGVEEQVVAGAGFDPDSDPVVPDMMPPPQEPMPEEPPTDEPVPEDLEGDLDEGDLEP